ncbi:MAG: DUF4932 domain-containing protein [Bacteroidota bacterium]|nr:DUF4932 domain-containing protein [Bacteroidota bacterium]
MKTLLKFTFIGLLLWCNIASGQQNTIKTNISEVYELANIILAITPYGINDPYEVNKESQYYKEVISYFKQYSNHPLISKVNYSRREWDKYLSFRTDSYGFVFDANSDIKRINKLRAIDTLNQFEENLELIKDFAEKSKFRQFFSDHKSYYDKLIATYNKSQMLNEVIQFLTDEFGSPQTNSEYHIVLSPLVGRMNCMREVNRVPTNFVTVPDWVIALKSPNEIPRDEFAENIHMLFTEVDHFFVNAATDKYKQIAAADFIPAKWDFGSGYERYDLATFNEYMTWAVYDIFTYKYFPEAAQKVCQNWILQNSSRGFYASSIFNKKLKQLYDKKKDDQKLKDLYPSFLEWCGHQQVSNSYPVIKTCSMKDKELTETTHAKYEIAFSEPMQRRDSIDIVVTTDKPNSPIKNITLTKRNNHMNWDNFGEHLTFELDLENNCTNKIMFNRWGADRILISKKGITLETYSAFKTKVNAK